MLEAFKKDLETKQRECEGSPRFVVIMIATLSAGEKIYINCARNVGDHTIEIIGTNVHNNKEQKVLVGIENLTLEVLVVDKGPDTPKLQLIKNDPEETE